MSPSGKANYGKYSASTAVEQFQVFTERQIDQIPQLQRLSAQQRRAMRVVAQVLPFRVNRYVIDELIDWDNVPDDPIFKLTFPQRGMLEDDDFERIAGMEDNAADVAEIRAVAAAVRAKLNPHPAGQQLLNVLRLFERLVMNGKHVAIMAHYNHWRELEPPIAREALRRLRATGAVIRSQSPLVAHINDDADVWTRLWRTQVRLGIVPYYMFVERDTGARRYFEVPLARAWEIYRDAIRQVSGVARTVRGPSMSAGPGKVEVQGVAQLGSEQLFVLRFIQGRNPEWVQRPFFARFDPQATWLDQLVPAGGDGQFFFQAEYDAMEAARY